MPDRAPRCAAVLCLLAAACATAPRGREPAAAPQAEAQSNARAVSGGAAPSPSPGDRSSGLAAEAGGSGAVPAGEDATAMARSSGPGGREGDDEREGGPLAWVNPARCLPSCAFDPGAALIRIDELGTASPQGRHQIDGAAADALKQLLAAALEAGHKLKVASAYRSYQEQVRVFRTTKEKGRAARPGHSEHQLGTAVDLRLPTSAAVTWLAVHAADHGFVVSYPDGRQRITGYRPEPWHVRFVGRALAREVRDSGKTLEELFRARPSLGTSGTCRDCPAPISRSRCGDVPESGHCSGDVLTWCYDGALAAVDCGLSRQICAATGDPPRHDCVDSPRAGETAGAE